MNCILRKNIVIGLLSVGMIGSVVYAGSQYALYSHEMKILAHEHVGTVFIHGEIHGQPFQWITNVEVSTALPGVSIVLSSPYSYTLRFQGMKGNKARMRFVVWQRGSQAKAGMPSAGKTTRVAPMVWESVVPSMAEKLGTKRGSSEPVYSPMSEMRYLETNPISAADGKMAGNAGSRNELQAAWISLKGE